MDRSNTYSACLICLKRFCSQSPTRHSSKIVKCQQSLLRFLQFCSSFLNVNCDSLVSAVQVQDGGLVRMLCIECHILLNNLEALEVKLLGVMVEVKEKLSQQSESFSSRMEEEETCRNIVKLSVDYRILGDFRKAVKEKCEAKIVKVLPTVIVDKASIDNRLNQSDLINQFKPPRKYSRTQEIEDTDESDDTDDSSSKENVEELKIIKTEPNLEEYIETADDSEGGSLEIENSNVNQSDSRDNPVNSGSSSSRSSYSTRRRKKSRMSSRKIMSSTETSESEETEKDFAEHVAHLQENSDVMEAKVAACPYVENFEDEDKLHQSGIFNKLMQTKRFSRIKEVEGSDNTNDSSSEEEVLKIVKTEPNLEEYSEISDDSEQRIEIENGNQSNSSPRNNPGNSGSLSSSCSSYSTRRRKKNRVCSKRLISSTDTSESDETEHIPHQGSNSDGKEPTITAYPSDDNFEDEDNSPSRSSPYPPKVLRSRKKIRSGRLKQRKALLEIQYRNDDSEEDLENKGIENASDPNYSPDDIEDEPQSDQPATDPDEEEIKINKSSSGLDKCFQCGSMFQSPLALKYHREDESHFVEHWVSNIVSKCDLCEATLANPDYLYNHKAKTHNLPEMLKCSICEKVENNVRELIDHLKANHENAQEKVNSCVYCCASFSTSQLFQLHRQFMHVDKPQKYLCDEDTCSMEFTSGEDLNTHLKVHNQRTYKCSICDIGFLAKYRLKLHKINHLKLVKDQLKCFECDKKFSVKSTLLTHLHQDHGYGGSKKLYKCTLGCTDFLSFSKKERDFHEKKRHILRSKFTCKYCHILYSDQEIFTSHMIAVHRKQRHKAGSYSCDKCTRKFKTHSNLQNHQKLHSSPNEVCYVCGKIFKYSFTLMDHLKTHTREEMMVCDVCGKEFYSKKYLVKHKLQTHVQRFSCTICGRKFASKQKQIQHTLNHTKWKLKCSQCEATFKGKKDLDKHVEEMHNDSGIGGRGEEGGKLGFECVLCSRAFGSEEEREIHARKEHPEEYVEVSEEENLVQMEVEAGGDVGNVEGVEEVLVELPFDAFNLNLVTDQDPDAVPVCNENI